MADYNQKFYFYEPTSQYGEFKLNIYILKWYSSKELVVYRHRVWNLACEPQILSWNPLETFVKGYRKTFHSTNMITMYLYNIEINENI